MTSEKSKIIWLQITGLLVNTAKDMDPGVDLPSDKKKKYPGSLQ
jgi:hypothetical protein